MPPGTGGILECRVEDPDRIDLAVRYLHEELAEAAPEPLRPLSRLWRAAPPPGQRVVWLELDLPAGSTPVASVFAGPGGLAPAMPPDCAEWQAILAALAADAPPEPVWRLLDCLPEGAWIGYLGWMRGRTLRATVWGLAPDAVPPLLHLLAWPGDRAALDLRLDLARHAAARLTLALDLAGAADPAWGIELSPSRAEGWPALLTAAALPAAWEAALLAWPGVSTTADGARLARRLNHVKFGPAGPPKAYLYYGLL
jgi:hypothetical protein